MSKWDNLKEKIRVRKWTITIVIILIIILALFANNYFFGHKKTIKVSGAYALYPMMCVWAEEYQELHPDIRIEVSGGGAGKGMTDALAGLVDLGMVSRDIYREELKNGAFYVSVCKDAVVATINSKNPVVNQLQQKGVTKEEFVKIFITREIKTWGELVNNSNVHDKINIYTRADACGAAKTWAKYLGNYTQEDLTNAADVAIMHDPDLAEAIKNDKLAIGYNNINFAYDMHTKKPLSGLQIVPIDLNNNNTIDEEEKCYDTRDEIVQAIADNVYPSPPARDLYLVTKNKFSGEAKKFVRWILTDGQGHLPENGYIQLPQTKLESELQVLETNKRP